MFSLTTIFFVAGFSAAVSVQHSATKAYCDEIDSCWKTFKKCNTKWSATPVERFMQCNDAYAVCAEGPSFVQPNKNAECYCKNFYNSQCLFVRAESINQCQTQSQKTTCQKNALAASCASLLGETLEVFVGFCTHIEEAGKPDLAIKNDPAVAKLWGGVSPSQLVTAFTDVFKGDQVAYKFSGYDRSVVKPAVTTHAAPMSHGSAPKTWTAPMTHGAAPKTWTAPMSHGAAPKSWTAPMSHGSAPKSWTAQKTHGAAPKSWTAPMTHGAAPKSWTAPTSHGSAPKTWTAPMPHSSSPSGSKAGAEICVVGYVMDNFCIKRGTLLNAPQYKSLQSPNEHNFVCLFDVPVCLNSGFEVLTAPKDVLPNGALPAGSNSEYKRAYQLDAFGNKQAVEVGRAIGSCGTCTNKASTLEKGFAATIRGTVDNSTNPPTLKVSSFTFAPEGWQTNPSDAKYCGGSPGPHSA